MPERRAYGYYAPKGGRRGAARPLRAQASPPRRGGCPSLCVLGCVPDAPVAPSGPSGGCIAACLSFGSAKELAVTASLLPRTAAFESSRRWASLMKRCEVAEDGAALREWTARCASGAHAEQTGALVDVGEIVAAMESDSARAAPKKAFVGVVACEGQLLAHRLSACASYAGPEDKSEWLFCLKSGQARSEKRPLFNWTGRLRPAAISPYRPVPASIPRPDYADTGYPEEEQSSPFQRTPPIMTPEEMEGMRAAGRLGRQVLDAAHRAVRPGATTDEIDRVVHEACVEAGAYPAPLRYFDFPKSVCTSVNEVICHGIPDARELQEGDAVNVDVTVIKDGFHGDLNETFVVGEPAPELKKLIQVTHECLHQAIDICKPGVPFSRLGEVISQHAHKEGFSVVKSFCGHGINRLFHCAPNIPHYAGNKARGMMKAGQCFTIEPMINAGKWQDKLWPDGWTAVTIDGKRSAQFEHTLLLGESGAEVMTRRREDSPKLCFQD